MSEDMHNRARSLANASRAESITDSDRAWLDAHLEECAECAAYAASVDRAVTALRSFQVSIDPAVMEATRRRVQLRAQELREQQSRRRGLWVACAFSWLLGVLSAPLLWLAFEWAGQRLSLPEPLWILALATCWFVPAAAAAAVLSWRKSNRSSAEADTLR